MKRPPAPSGSILEAVGSTPLIRLQRIARGIRTPVYGKAENLNPGGSVKDRIGLAIIEGAEQRGDLEPDGVIVEATSGNTGVGLAVAAAIKGYRCIFTIPDKMSSEKIRLLRGFGAEVVVVPTAVPPDHPEYYVEKAKGIVKSTPGAILANQFDNPDNPEAHYRTTGPEIWEQTEGRVTHFTCASGTGAALLDRPVSEVMAEPFPVVDADVPLDRLVAMLKKGTPAALVREGGRLVGIVNRYDVLREVAGIG